MEPEKNNHNAEISLTISGVAAGAAVGAKIGAGVGLAFGGGAMVGTIPIGAACGALCGLAGNNVGMRIDKKSVRTSSALNNMARCFKLRTITDYFGERRADAFTTVDGIVDNGEQTSQK